ncbi:hypothetical protein PJP07_30485, partial [Mycobacterium kansasii]
SITATSTIKKEVLLLQAFTTSSNIHFEDKYIILLYFILSFSEIACENLSGFLFVLVHQNHKKGFFICDS